ncbi:hypothetical protein PQI07_06610 [Methylobacterium sp. 092160098-2]|uniref:hypothetical protein n=1 Tax=Methylobacterium sp. 092160098-2 TaxID=3025129 RepID=UPI002381CD18|nr:hypothetical protein [Methylobacterium sp. 092160098-2]MDE4910373.1 hypothetical protein [Methylobacterium sp. 092160098-2]
MLGILGTIFGWIGGGLIKVLGSNVIGPLVQTIQNGQNANRDVAVQTLQAEIAANQARVAIAPAFKGLIYCIGLPAAVHFGAICADSMLWWFPFYGWHLVGSWKVATLPGDYATIEATILTAFFVSSPLTTLARAGAARLLKA